MITLVNTASRQSSLAPANSDLGELGERRLTAAVCAKLRGDVICNRLVQSHKLRLGELQERFGVSLGVVCEALSRLVADGLLNTQVQRGFRVTAISRKDLLDVTQSRIHIVSLSLQIAIEKGNDAWVAEMESVFDQMHGVDRVRESERWILLHGRFHRTLLAPCDSTWLMHFRDVLFDQSERYRYLFMSIDTGARLPVRRDVDGEHRAVRNGRAGDASEALESHFSTTAQGILAAVDLA